MNDVSVIGLDIAKSVFQVHGTDDEGNTVIRKRLSRRKVLAFFADLPPCLVGIEACPRIGTFCIYQARDPESIREHARRVGMPGDDFYKVATTVVIRDDPIEAATAA